MAEAGEKLKVFADGKRVVTVSGDKTARIWDVSWATLARGDALRERVNRM